MTRHYFKGVYAKRVYKPRKKKPKPKQLVMGTATRANGRKKQQILTAGQARRRVGEMKGGLAIQAAGTAHRWTSEEARKAALKSWRKKGRFNKVIGARIGRSVVRRPHLDHAALREQYALSLSYPAPSRESDVWYNPLTFEWVRDGRVISERQALKILGHLPSKRTFIPETVTPIHYPRRGGTSPAGTGEPESTPTSQETV